jgi:hypothetical protein
MALIIQKYCISQTAVQQRSHGKIQTESTFAYIQVPSVEPSPHSLNITFEKMKKAGTSDIVCACSGQENGRSGIQSSADCEGGLCFNGCFKT